MHLQVNILFDLDLGARSHQMLSSTLYIMWHIHVERFKLLRLTVKEKMHLQKKYII